MGAYVGINSTPAGGYTPVAKKVKKIYVGDGNGIARLVKKAYVGVNGIAKLFWSESGIVYYGTVTSFLSQDYMSSSNQNYAIFAGGANSSGTINTVIAFDSNLNRRTPTSLNQARRDGAGARTGPYALIAGGYYDNWANGSNMRNTVDAYDNSLARSTPVALNVARAMMSGTSLGKYALFAGGTNYAAYQSAVDIYDDSLIRTTSSLNLARNFLNGASNQNYAIFAGGWNYSARNNVDVYDTSLTKKTVSPLITERLRMATASGNDYAIFAGGSSADWGNGTRYNVVEAYDCNLVKSTLTGLEIARSNFTGVSLKNYSLFGGGNNSNGKQNIVEMYDKNLVRSTIEPLSSNRSHFRAEAIGNYMIFGSDVGNENADVYEVV